MFFNKFFNITVATAIILMSGCVNSEIHNIAPGDPQSIRVAMVPTEDVQQQLLNLEPLRVYLSENVGIPFEFQITTDYSGAIEALKYKHVELAWLGPFTYVLASQMTDIEPLIAGVRSDSGAATYNSILVTRKDSGIQTPEDIRGRTFAFLDPASTSGYLVPMHMFKELNIDPEMDFSSVVYAGSHSAVELAVFNGTVDAGADSLPSFNLMVDKGLIDPDQMIIFWTSEDIPPSPLVIRGDLDENLKDKIREAWLNAPGVIAAEGQMDGYISVTDQEYDFIREIVKSLDLDLKEFK